MGAPSFLTRLLQNRLLNNVVWSPELLSFSFVTVEDALVKVLRAKLQGIDTLQRRIYWSTLSLDNFAGQVVIFIATNEDVWSCLACPYDLSGVVEVPLSLEDMTPSDFYIWDSRFETESAFSKDSPKLGIPLDLDAVGDLVRQLPTETKCIQWWIVWSIPLMS